MIQIKKVAVLLGNVNVIIIRYNLQLYCSVRQCVVEEKEVKKVSQALP